MSCQEKICNWNAENSITMHLIPPSLCTSDPPAIFYALMYSKLIKLHTVNTVSLSLDASMDICPSICDSIDPPKQICVKLQQEVGHHLPPTVKLINILKKKEKHKADLKSLNEPFYPSPLPASAASTNFLILFIIKIDISHLKLFQILLKASGLI